MADIKAHYKATVKKYSTFSLILAIVLVNIWLLNNGERVLPPDIYTQNVSIIYGIILAVIMGIWFITLYAEKRTHIITELYQISIRDSLVGMVLGTTLVLMVFWVVFGAILGETPRDLGWEGYIALIVLHGLIVAPIETITAQKMIVDIVGYVPAAIFFAGMHAAVYGFSAGTLLFAFTMGYIWSRLIGLKTEKWFYGMLGMGFVISFHACYNIGIVVYGADTLMLLSFAGPYTWSILFLLLGIVILFEVMHIKSERDIVGMEERTCEICGMVLLKRQKRFCSNKCNGMANRGENNPFYKPEIHERSCEVCGNLYPAENKRFCSHKCRGKWMSGENNPRYNLQIDEEKTCEICGSPLTRRQITSGHGFCSRKCSGKWMTENLHGANHYRYRPELHDGFCKICGEPLTKRKQIIFCSTNCSGRWISINQSGENSPHWRGGVKNYTSQFFNMRETIRDRDERTCQYCGTPQSELGSKLDVHHINYDKMDNREENLISLCKSCHTKTGHRRWYWEAILTLCVQEKSSIQSRLHLIPQEEQSPG